jgi:hypothetical protein
MIEMTREERHLRALMIISAITYFVVGLAFVLMPGQILRVFNLCSRIITPGLEEIPLSVEKFWLSMTFSMMMTIAALCYIAQHNIRKNKAYIIPLLISKSASSLSALCFFIFSARYLAYLGIFIVDGSIFWITLFFYVRASKAFFEAQTAYLRKKPVIPKNTGPTTVVAIKGDDKFAMLDRILEETGFFEILERRFKDTGKSREEFSVVIKPNFMYMHSKKDISSYTDPEC